MINWSKMGTKNINMGWGEGIGSSSLSSSSMKKISRALVVDDSTINRKIHHKLLDNLGIDSEMVANGKEAVDIHCSGKNFDLILMDMEMPIMDGIQATKKLREMGIRSMIAGVSTRSMEKEKKEFMEAGLDDYQEKPLTVAKLIAILRKCD